MVGTFRKSHVGNGGESPATYASENDTLVGEVHESLSEPLRNLLQIPLDRSLTTQEVGKLLSARTAQGHAIQGRKTIVYDGTMRRRVAFTDFTFSAPRSFSIALALAPSENERIFLENCFVRANRDMLGHILPLLGHTRTRDGAIADVAAITYHHATSRPTNVAADMNRHSHNLILHTALANDGRVLSANLSSMRGNVKAWGAVGHAYLATYLREGGVKVDIDPKTGVSRLPDVPEALVSEFSSRTRQATLALPVGASRKQVKRQLARTRRDKDGPPDYASWTMRAQRVGYEHQSVMNRGGGPVAVDHAAIHVDGPTPRIVAARKLIATGIQTRKQVDDVLVKPLRASSVRQRQKTTTTAPQLGETIVFSKRVNARYSATSNGYFASPNHEAVVIAVTQRGIALQRGDGKIGEVRWATLLDKSTGQLALVRKPEQPKRRARNMDEAAVRDAFGAYLRQQGLKIEGQPIMDGKYHYVQVMDEKTNARKGRYVGYLDGRPAGHVNNYKRQVSVSWKFQGSYQPPSAEQRREQRAEQAKREALRMQDRENGIKNAWTIWDRSISVSDTGHAYLVAKDMSGDTFRVDPDTGNLIIAMRDRNSKLVNVQRITPDGRGKYVIKNAPVTGTYGQFGKANPGQPILIAEGAATAEAIYKATGFTTRYAFNAGNLETVAKITREQFPTSKIVMMADNDHTLPRREDLPEALRINIGVVKAERAAEVVGNATVLKPRFGPDVETGPLQAGAFYPTDYNDLQKIIGKQQLKVELMQSLKEIGVEAKTIEFKQQAVTQAQRDTARAAQVAAEVALVSQTVAQQQRSQDHNRGPEL